jgi:hypothetical protein
MAAMADIVLADGQASPANHTFVPVSNVNGIFTWEELNADASVGNRRLTASLRRATSQNPNYKAELKVWNPQLEVTSPSTATGYQPAPKVAYALSAIITVVIPERSATANRKDETAFMANLLANSQIKSILNDLVTPN